MKAISSKRAYLVLICIAVITAAYSLIELFRPAADHAPVAAEEQVNMVTLNPTALKNFGINDSTIGNVKVVDYYKSLTFPAVVVELPGFSSITVPSTVSGVVAKIYFETGSAVAPGEPLFDILLNQQELVKIQTEFLMLLRRREINAAELSRLADIGSQIVPLERRELEYEKLQIDSEIGVQKNILLLQGLKAGDISDSLEKKGEIIRTITVIAPPLESQDNVASSSHATSEEHIYTVDELFVTPGKNIDAGDSLCTLTDYCKLAIQGRAFAVDEKVLTQALISRSRVSAAFEGNTSREIVEGLVLRSIDNKLDIESGALFCYLDLTNRFTSYQAGTKNNPRRYVQWHFKPGQRCELSIEYEPLPDCIVLPIGALAKDFSDMCVFEWVGNDNSDKIWLKKPVHVIYQTKDAVVIANDGNILPGAKVALKGASFILAALEAENQKGTGGGVIDHGDHVH